MKGQIRPAVNVLLISVLVAGVTPSPLIDGREFVFTSNRELEDNRPWLVTPGDDKLIMLSNPAYHIPVDPGG